MTKKIKSNYTVKINNEAAAREAQHLSNTSFIKHIHKHVRIKIEEIDSKSKRTCVLTSSEKGLHHWNYTYTP